MKIKKIIAGMIIVTLIFTWIYALALYTDTAFLIVLKMFILLSFLLYGFCWAFSTIIEDD